MYKLFITNGYNQTISWRAKEIEKHKGEKIVACIDNGPTFDLNEWSRFQFPMYSEGIDEIELMYDRSNIEGLLKEAKNREVSFNHNDKWHNTETLKSHNDRLKEDLKDVNGITSTMVLLHDFGKPTTVKPNPKDSNFLCYYNHEAIGTREIISYMSTKDIEDYYKVLIVCSYHMMFINKDWNLKNKPEVFDILKKEQVYELLERFSQADNLPANN